MRGDAVPAWLRWLSPCVLTAALSLSCGAPAEEPGLSVRVQMPRVILPSSFDPAQGDDATTFADVRIEVREGQRVVAGRTLRNAEATGGATLTSLPPGSFRLVVLAGRVDETGQTLGLITHSVFSRVSIGPEERTQTSVTLVRCDEDPDFDPAEGQCNPDFGQELEAPEAPELFPLPEFSSCDGNADARGTPLQIAGTKPFDSSLVDENRNVLDPTTDTTTWSASVRTLFDLRRSPPFTQNLRARRRAFGQEAISEGVAQVRFGRDENAICFNPYDVGLNPPDIGIGNGNDLTVRWDAGNRIGDLAVVVVAPDSSPQGAVRDLGTLDTLVQVDPVSVGAEVTSFNRPSTSSWDALLYVREPGMQDWFLEGTFRYNETWLIEQNHPELP